MDSVWIGYSGSRTTVMRFDCARLALTVGLAFCIATPAWPEDGPSAADSQTVRQIQHLIGQLDADTRSERVKAHDALLKLGPAILPLLPEDKAIASAAARQSLQEIRLRLQREAALASLSPSRVTLKGTFSLRSVLEQIASQTGNEFDTHALGDQLLERRVTVDFRSRTFWSVCDTVVSSVGLEYGTTSARRRLELVRATRGSSERPLAVADEGAFRIAVASASIRPSVASRAGDALHVGWSLMAEPRLRPLFAAIAGRDLHAQTTDASASSPRSESPDASQRALTVFRPISPAAKLELSMNEGQEPLRLETQFDFPTTGTSTPRIDFSGSFAVEMAAAPVQIAFDDLVTPNQPAKRVGSVAVRLRQVEIPVSGKAGQGRVDLSVVYDQRGPAFESYRTWMYHNEVWLETKSGRRLLPRPIVATQREADAGVAVEYNFADMSGTPADYRLVYVAPTLVTRSPVHFQLRNIPTTRVGQQGAQP
jgi:hypothetical protein